MNSIAKLSINHFVGILGTNNDGFFRKVDVFEVIIVQYYEPIDNPLENSVKLVLLKGPICP